jgi:head-tail adaptor
MKNINAGDLRHRVTLVRNAAITLDPVNQATPSPQSFGPFYALVECLGGAEATSAGQRKGTLKYRITLRASAGPILPTDSFVWNGHTLNVVAAVPDPFGIMIEIDATEKGPQ